MSTFLSFLFKIDICLSFCFTFKLGKCRPFFFFIHMKSGYIFTGYKNDISFLSLRKGGIMSIFFYSRANQIYMNLLTLMQSKYLSTFLNKAGLCFLFWLWCKADYPIILILGQTGHRSQFLTFAQSSPITIWLSSKIGLMATLSTPHANRSYGYWLWFSGEKKNGYMTNFSIIL